MDQNKTYGLFWTGDFDQYYIGHQAEEILKARIYAPYLENKKDAVVIDCGGNIGLFSLYAAKYAKQVYCLEPTPEHQENIERMLLFNEMDNVKLIKKAVWLENTTLPFYRNPNKTMNSLHQAVAHPELPPLQVEAVTLEQLFADEGIEHVDLLKMDIEGSEIEVFASPSFRAVAPKIDVVVTERHAWSGRHPNQLNEALKSNGFEVMTVPNDADIVIGVRRNG